MPSSGLKKIRCGVYHRPLDAPSRNRLGGHRRRRDPLHALRWLALDRHPAFVFFNDTATTEIYTLSLHDALPISFRRQRRFECHPAARPARSARPPRSEEHTSELQSLRHLVCRLLLEKKELT